MANVRRPKLHNSYYNNGSNAYDNEITSKSRIMKKKTKIKKKIKPKIIKDNAQGNKLSIMHIVSIIVIFACIATFAITIGMVTTQKGSNAKLKNKLSQLQEANAETQNLINDRVDYDLTKKIAEVKLGMSAPKSYQIIPVTLPKQSYVVVENTTVESGNKQSFLDKVFSNITNKNK